jgi:hypothetical protein
MRETSVNIHNTIGQHLSGTVIVVVPFCRGNDAAFCTCYAVHVVRADCFVSRSTTLTPFFSRGPMAVASQELILLLLLLMCVTLYLVGLNTCA